MTTKTSKETKETDKSNRSKSLSMSQVRRIMAVVKNREDLTEERGGESERT